LGQEEERDVREKTWNNSLRNRVITSETTQHRQALRPQQVGMKGPLLRVCFLRAFPALRRLAQRLDVLPRLQMAASNLMVYPSPRHRMVDMDRQIFQSTCGSFQMTEAEMHFA